MEHRILEFFKKHKIEPAQTTARSFIFDCPACGSTKKLYIQKKDGTSVCFRQGDADRCPRPGSRPFYPLHLLSGLSMDEIKSEFMDDRISDGNEMSVSMDPEDLVKKEEPISMMSPDSWPIDALPVLHAFSQDGTAYLKSRGITEDIMNKYGILYSDAMRRIIFPVFIDGFPYGWQGRAVDQVDKAYRMYNLPGPWKAKTVMFYDNLGTSEHAIIAEGAVSALKFERVGGFVATMGKNISQAQIELIANRSIKRIYLALDRDANDQLEKLYKSFLSLDNPIKDVYIVEVPSHREDFGDCTFEECEEAFKKAKPYNPNTINIFLETKLTTAEKLKKIDTTESAESDPSPSMELEDLLPLAKIYATRSFNKNSSYYEAAVMDVQDVESIAYIYTYLYLKKFKKSKLTRNVFCDDLVLHLLRLVHTLEVEYGKIAQIPSYPSEIRCSLALNRIFTI